jgi:hypothetical protein
LGPAGGKRLSFYFGCWCWRVDQQVLFLIETCFPKILDPIKQNLKNHKNMNHSYLDI